LINSLIREYRSSGKGIVIPVYDGKRGHPLLLDHRYREQIDKLDPDEGLRSITSLYPGDILEVKTDDKGILLDFDTYDDYIKEFNQKQ